MFKFKTICILTLLVFSSAGFSFLDDFSSNLIAKSRVEAARRSRKSKSNSNSKKTEKKEDKKSEKEDNNDLGLLQDNDKSKDYMPDIYRCPDCGYEQDEPGFCPDHTTLELIKIISNPNDPLSPTELDGNEDILVDVPLNIDFKKDELELKKEDEKTKESNSKKTTQKSKKSKSK